jgi:hypothetical protein
MLSNIISRSDHCAAGDAGFTGRQLLFICFKPANLQPEQTSLLICDEKAKRLFFASIGSAFCHGNWLRKFGTVKSSMKNRGII